MSRLMLICSVCFLATTALGFQNAPAVSPRAAQSTAILIVLKNSLDGTAPLEILDLCTVSIGAKDLMLTAAHCVSDSKGHAYSASHLAVYLGNIDPLAPLERNRMLRVEQTKIHKHYAPDGGPDLALVKLKQAVPKPYQPAPPVAPSFLLSDLGVVRAVGAGTGPWAGRPLPCCTLSQVTPSQSRQGFSYSAIDLTLPVGIEVSNGDSGGPALIEQGTSLMTFGVLKGNYIRSPEWLKFEDLRHHHEWLTQSAAEMGSRF